MSKYKLPFLNLTSFQFELYEIMEYLTIVDNYIPLGLMSYSLL